MRSLFLTAVLLVPFIAFAQNSSWNASLEAMSFAGNRSSLPFWLTQNRMGKLSAESNHQQLAEGTLSGSFLLHGGLRFSYGTDVTFLQTEHHSDFTFIEAYAGLNGRVLTLKAGTFAGEELFGGLSSSNGNVVRSLNYRPYPMIRLSTSGYVPIGFARSWLRVKAEYDEGLLRDERIVDDPHIHHKSISFQFLPGETFRFSAGIDHYVFWGGTLPDGTKQPSGLKNYFRYVLGRNGDSGFLEPDQVNVAGNQLGAYLILAEKEFKSVSVQLQVSHPFEDRSGMELDNLPDNLYTIHISRNEKGSFIDELLAEFLYSRQQSGSYHLISGPGKHKRGMDNYFNHSVYTTGFSYEGYSMGTPLFYPLVKDEEGVYSGFANNRVAAFHVGAKGYLSERLEWKGLLTYSENWGTFDCPYGSVKRQVYSLAEVSWGCKKLPFRLSGYLAADYGSLVDHRLGGGLSVKWVIR